MRALIVHNATQVKLALQAAQQCGNHITLQTAPDAMFYAGALYLLRMYNQEKVHFPDVTAEYIIDCADSGAEAVQAMQMGHKHIRSSAAPEIQQKLAAIAKDMGIGFHNQPYESLDLMALRGTKDEIIQWIEEKA